MPFNEGAALTLLGLDQQKESKSQEAMSWLTMTHCSQQTPPSLSPHLPPLVISLLENRKGFSMRVTVSGPIFQAQA